MASGSTDEFQAALAIGETEHYLRTTVQASRPVRIPDGSGGFFEIMGDAFDVLCDPIQHQTGQILVVREDADVRIGDLVQIPYNT